MPEFPAGLISDAELKSTFTQRAKSVDEKRVTASSKEALATLVKGYEQDGCRTHSLKICDKTIIGKISRIRGDVLQMLPRV